MVTFEQIYDRLRRKTNTTSFIPQIDGLRFLAIVLVLIEHIHDFVITKIPFSFSGHPATDYWWFYNLFDKNGPKGVFIFFMISGFILALPFAKSYWQQSKPVNLKKYFLRRLTRLEPPYIITMVTCYFLIILFGRHEFARMFPNLSFIGLLPNLTSSLLYVHNFFYPWVLSVNSVAWSLEVEVQFYILVPLLVLILKLAKAQRRVFLVFLVFLFSYLHQNFPAPVYSIYSFIQFFLLGFLLVDLYLSGWQPKINKSLSFLIGVLFLAFIFYIDLFRFPIYEYFFIIAIFCLGALVLTSEVWQKIFSIRIFTAIGGMCYSIYLWHTILISGVGNFTIRFNLTHSYLFTILWHFAILLPIILLFTTCFYVLIERPCMDKDWPFKLSLFIRKITGKKIEPSKDF